MKSLTKIAFSLVLYNLVDCELVLKYQQGTAGQGSTGIGQERTADDDSTSDHEEIGRRGSVAAEKIKKN